MDRVGFDVNSEDSDSRTLASRLELRIDCRQLPVSSLSSLLRVVQAAIREVARSNEDTRQSFS